MVYVYIDDKEGQMVINISKFDNIYIFFSKLYNLNAKGWSSYLLAVDM